MSKRRYLRIKVMQFLYAQKLSGEDPKKIQNEMFYSIKEIFNLYICLIGMLLGLKEKFFYKLQILKKKNIYKNFFLDKKFAYNKLLILISKNLHFCKYISKNQDLNWKNYEKYLSFFFKQIQEIPFYKNLSSLEKYSFQEDKNFILHYYENFFANNEKLYECFEDGYLTWLDDLSIAHIMVYNTLKFIKSNASNNYKFYKIYYNSEDKNFIKQLFYKTEFYKEKFNILIGEISNHWKINRIAFLDLIILQMSICEFLYFPNIPPRVTINEYIEISKIYSTNKSKIFINGILDQLFKNLINQKKIHKIGRGLL